MSIRRILASASVLVAATWFCGTAHAQDGTPKKWTFLVFLNGDNNLDQFSVTNLNQMQQVGSTNDVNILVLRDRYSQSTTTKILYVQKGSSKTVKDMGKNIDMGDWKQVVEFFKYAKENYPAEHYVIDMWDHGGGWGKSARGNVTRDISWDDHSGNYITTAQLGQAMAEIKALNGGKNVDILGMDACLMQAAEVVAQVAPSVNVVVASEEVEPGEGWDYAAPLKLVTSNPNVSALDFAAKIATAYVDFNSSQDVQSSATSASALVAAQAPVKALMTELAKFDKISKTKMGEIINATQKFYMADFRDLPDFLDRVGNVATDPALQALVVEAEKAVKAVVYANYTHGSTMAGAQGITVWLPDSYTYSSKKAKYAQMTWGVDSGWANFLAKLYE